MAALIQTEQREHVLEIILNRPDKRNAINLAMYDQLGEAITRIERAPGIRAILIRGAGPAFSSGIDLNAFLELPQRYGEGWRQRLRTVSQNFQAVLTRLERLEVPTIALLHGHCLGLALEIALACDLRLAAEGTQLALPEARLGLIPDVGGTTRLTRLVGPARAKEIIFTGRQIDARQAGQWGLVNEVVPADQLADRAEALVAEISQAAPLAVGLAKRVIDGAADLDRGLMLEVWAQSHLLTSEDFGEAVQSYLSRQPPRFKGR